MSLLAIQITLILFLVFVLGVLVGWSIYKLMRRSIDKAWLNELLRLRKSRKKLVERACRYRQQSRKKETQRKQLMDLLETRTDHVTFSKVRQQLEHCRTQLHHANALLRQREQHILKLLDVVRLLKGQVDRHQAQSLTVLPNSPSNAIPYASGHKHKVLPDDDFLVIEGITTEIARKLRQLGITSYRQLAECTPKQQQTIQQLIGQGNVLPIHRWTRTALDLYRNKYEAKPQARPSFADKAVGQL